MLQYKDHVFTTPVSKLDSILQFFSKMLYTNFIFLPSLFVYKYIYMYHVSYSTCVFVTVLSYSYCIIYHVYTLCGAALIGTTIVHHVFTA